MALDSTIKNDSMTSTLAPGATPAPAITVGGIDTAQVQKNIADFSSKNGGSLSTAQPQAPAAAPASGNLDMSGFAGIVDTMRTKLAANNVLADTRTKLLNVLYNRALTPDELSTLDPSTQNLVRGGDKNQIEMEIRMINDKIAGRTNTLDSSVQYLTSAYKDTLAAADAKRKDAIDVMNTFINKYGEDAPLILNRQYPGLIDQLKGYGIDLSAGVTPDTTHSQETSPEPASGYGASVSPAIEPTKKMSDLTPDELSTLTNDMATREGFGQGNTVADRNNNPGNIKYGDFAKSLGATDSGIVAKDGGTFAKFSTADDGKAAMSKLLQSASYSGLTVDQAMRRWSGATTGASLKPSHAVNTQILTDHPTQASTIQGISDYSIAPPSRFTAAGANMIKLVKQYDPAYDDKMYKVRSTFVQNWNNPDKKSYTTRVAANTALAHFGDYFEEGQKLQNLATSKAGPFTKSYNSIKQWLAENSGDENVKEYDYTANQLAAEVAQVYKGTASPTQDEIAEQRAILEKDLTPTQIGTVVTRAIDLLSKKLQATRGEYKNVMGTDVPAPLIDENSRQVIQNLADQGYYVPIDDIDPPVGTDVSYTPIDISGLVKTKGYDYDAMRKAGNTDSDIIAALKKAGKI